jgi:glycosyltransferase involved in cell wall biosynthesis
MKVSILIAVYNTEKFLYKCLDSLIYQTYQDWEAICVDDCSTDASLSILNDYATRDGRIRVVHLTENQGQAKARNEGIKICTGQLVCFLDSDDWFADTTLEQTVRVFKDNEKADCVLMRCIKKMVDGQEYELAAEARFPISGKEAFELSLDWTIHGIYMTRMDIQRRIPYDDTCRSFSDDNTTRLHYLDSREVDMSEGIYYYRENPSSVSNKVDVSRFNFLLANEHMQEMLREMKADVRLIRLHERVRWLNLIGAYRLMLENEGCFSDKEKDYAMCLMKKIWEGIDTECLPNNIKYKPGYAALPNWFLFRLQQVIYVWVMTHGRSRASRRSRP